MDTRYPEILTVSLAVRENFTNNTAILLWETSKDKQMCFHTLGIYRGDSMLYPYVDINFFRSLVMH